MNSASDRRLLVCRAATVLTVLSGVLLDTSASIAAEPHAYRIASGDRIAITLFGQPELSSGGLVDQNGNLRLPIAGGVAAAAKARQSWATSSSEIPASGSRRDEPGGSRDGIIHSAADRGAANRHSPHRASERRARPQEPAIRER